MRQTFEWRMTRQMWFLHFVLLKTERCADFTNQQPKALAIVNSNRVFPLTYFKSNEIKIVVWYPDEYMYMLWRFCQPIFQTCFYAFSFINLFKRAWDILKWITKSLLRMINEGLYNVGIVRYRSLLPDIYDVILGCLCPRAKFFASWTALRK